MATDIDEVADTLQSDAQCSFCEKKASEVRRLVAGATAHICDGCVQLSVKAVEDRDTEDQEQLRRQQAQDTFASPQSIFDFLGEHVASQDPAKKALAVALYLHYTANKGEFDYNSIKQNVVMLGPTGVGKTMLLKTIAKRMNMPLAIVSATAYTQAGYVGEDVEGMFYNLLEAANGDIEHAQRGIIFLDEIDKIARRRSSAGGYDRDVGGMGVQQALLTMLEGAKISVPTTRDGYSVRTTKLFDTSNVLFVGSGAFVGLEKIIEKRLHGSAVSRFDDVESAERHPQKRHDQLLAQVTTEDLIEFGFIPEFAGRFSQYITLKHLYREDLLKIAVNKNASVFERYRSFFQSRGIELEIGDDYLHAVVNQALEMKTGARGLRQIVSDSMTKLIFDMQKWHNAAVCRLDKAVLEGEAAPKLFSKDKIPVLLDRSRVFISYSRRDAQRVNECLKVLKPLMNTKDIDIWSDQRVQPGEDWQARIDNSMARSKVAIFFVSANFLASEHTLRELQYFLQVKDAENVTVLWILMEACLHDAYDIAKFQAAHDTRLTIDRMKPAERKEVWVTLSRHLKETFAGPAPSNTIN